MSEFIPQFVPQIRAKDADEVHKQIMSGWIGPAKTTLALEAEICKITKAKHCISTTSGTTAIILALKSLNLPTNATVLFPSYTFLAGANACRFLQYNVKLVDIHLMTLCMNPTLVQQILQQNKIDCVMFVNHNAYVGEDVGRIRQLCNLHSIPMIEDSSQAIGVYGAGITGDLGIFSFSVPKLITTGQGGAIITNNDQLAANCRALRDHGDHWRHERIHNHIGGNFKFNDILAAYGLSQLQDINELSIQRKIVFDRYRMHLPILDYGYDSTWMVLYRSNCLMATEIIAALAKQNIQAVQYYRPINHNPPYEDKLNYPAAELCFDEIVYLPSSLNLEAETIDKICQIILSAERK